MKHILISTLLIICVGGMVIAQSTREATHGHSSDSWLNDDGSPKARFLFGGQKDDGSFSNELWKQEGNEFTKLPLDCDIPARIWHESFIDEGPVVTGASFKLYIFGGVDAEGNTLNDVWELYYHSDGVDCRKLNPADFPSHLKGHLLQRIHYQNNIGYAAGGVDANGKTSNKFTKITPTGNPEKPLATQDLANMLDPLAGGGTVVRTNHFYYIGGKNNDWNLVLNGNQPSYSRLVWRYNAQTNSWEEVRTTPLKATNDEFPELTEFAYTDNGTSFYAFGGKSYNYSNNTEFLTDGIYKLNLNTFTWQLVGRLPIPLAGATADFISENLIWIVNGETTEAGQRVVSDKIYVFNTIDNSITQFVPSTIIESETETIRIYPNPLTQTINIVDVDEGRLIIYDMYGKEVLSKNFNGNQIDISGLINGFYIVEIISQDKTIRQSILKL